MSKPPKMKSVNKTGDRLSRLKSLASILAFQIDICSDDPEAGPKMLPPLAKQYRDTIREIEEIEGVGDGEDEIGAILSSRSADGKSDAVR